MGHFLRTLVDEQNEEMDLRIELADGEANLLEEDGFSRLRRGHDEASLASADWGHQIDDAERYGTFGVLRKPQPFGGVLAHELLIVPRWRQLFDLEAVDALDLEELLVGRSSAAAPVVPPSGDAGRALEEKALFQEVFLYQPVGDANILRRGKEVVADLAKMAVSLRIQLEHAFSGLCRSR
jgi:hypothetical protein